MKSRIPPAATLILIALAFLAQAGVAASASGARIVYARARATDRIPGYGETHLWAMNPDGTGSTLVAGKKGTWYRDPEWSPDGSKIVYSRGRDWLSLADVIAIADADGGNQIKIGIGNDPTWSPDGTHLAYVAGVAYPVYRALRVAAIDKTSYVDIDGPIYPSDPDWSPDGKTIVFVQNPSEDVYDLARYDFDTGQVTTLTSLLGQFSSPEWSPDGQSILATYFSPQGDWDVAVMAADGSGLTLFETRRDEWEADWSPDGSSIIFSGKVRKQSDLFTMLPDGTNVTRLTSTPDQWEFSPDW